MSPRALSILIVDDHPDESALLADELRRRAIKVRLTHPSGVTRADLAAIDLVLVDLTLDTWAERDAADQVAMRPADGLALAAVLESHLPGSATGFALYSANLDQLSTRLASPRREHVLSRLHNMEWAFPKSPEVRRLGSSIESLAEALRDVAEELLSSDAQRTEHAARGLLGISGGEDWHANGWRDVEQCFPPLYELSEDSHGRAFVRWLAHRILPYPTFLVEAAYVCAFLGLPTEASGRALDDGAPIGAMLRPVKYTGILSSLIGDRWWKAGVERLVSQSAGGTASPRATLREMDPTLPWVAFSDAVVCVDESYAPSEVMAIERAVRIQPDDWPPFADSAWVGIEAAREDPIFRAKVVQEDVELLDR